MVARITTGALWGVDAYRVDVEVSLTQALPNVIVIGLPDGAVKEARMRIEASVRALGVKMPNKRVTFSLAPSDRRKGGSSFDLPMAVGLLEALELVPIGSTRGTAFAGELGLDGSLRPVRGVLAQARLAREEGCRQIVVPKDNAGEAAVIRDITVLGASSLSDVALHLIGRETLPETPLLEPNLMPRDDGMDLLDVRGQPVARRALEIAAAGGHHLIYLGPPGTGKSMLARRLPGLLPPMSLDEAVQVTQIYSAAGLLGDRPLVEYRPFRAPHHTATEVALIGGGHHQVRVGELSLAHLGVLFLDEAAEFPRSVLDALREPIENGEVDICRAEHRVRLPARSQMVIALNPCPCGYRGQERRGRSCTCTPSMADRYLRRLSGPLLDRVDLQLELEPVPMSALQGPPDAEPTRVVRQRVLNARKAQARRLEEKGRPRLNAWMSTAEMRAHCSLEPEARRIVHLRAEQQGLSARGLDRVLRVARTTADLDGAKNIRARDVYEALSYRTLEQLLRRGRMVPEDEKLDGKRSSKRARPLGPIKAARSLSSSRLRDLKPDDDGSKATGGSKSSSVGSCSKGLELESRASTQSQMSLLAPSYGNEKG